MQIPSKLDLACQLGAGVRSVNRLCAGVREKLLIGRMGGNVACQMSRQIAAKVSRGPLV